MSLPLECESQCVIGKGTAYKATRVWRTWLRPAFSLSGACLLKQLFRPEMPVTMRGFLTRHILDP